MAGKPAIDDPLPQLIGDERPAELAAGRVTTVLDRVRSHRVAVVDGRNNTKE